MKKMFLLILLLLTSVTLASSKSITNDELNAFINKNSLNYDDLKEYLNLRNFQLNDYFELEALRVNNHYNYLETINYFHYNSIKPAVLYNTNLILVNKKFYLDKFYIPKNLIAIPETINHANENIIIQTIVLENYLDMIISLKLGNLALFSGYRDYYKQEALYNYYQDDNYSAKPGFSEHQTGLAIDVSRKDIGLTTLFKDTHEYQVLIKNCHNYGFILRYPDNKQNQTGYYYEPWHFRYVGKIHAKYIMENNLTLEEYLYANFEF